MWQKIKKFFSRKIIRLSYVLISITIIAFLYMTLLGSVLESDTLFGAAFLGMFTELGALVGGGIYVLFRLVYKNVFGVTFVYVYFGTLNLLCGAAILFGSLYEMMLLDIQFYILIIINLAIAFIVYRDILNFKDEEKKIFG